jgi:hypothetical protein
VGTACRRENMVEILYTHVWKWKIKSVETVLGMGVCRIKENDGGSEFNYDTL